MAKLPRNVSPLECIKVLEKAGFIQKRQKGSHVTMIRDEPFAMTVVPVHRKNIDTGTLRTIIRQAELTVEAFVALLKA